MSSHIYPKRFVVYGHQRVARYEIEDMRAYARMATALMSGEAEKHRAYVDNVVKDMSEREREAYFHNNVDTHELMLRRFPNQRNSPVTAVVDAFTRGR